MPLWLGHLSCPWVPQLHSRFFFVTQWHLSVVYFGLSEFLEWDPARPDSVEYYLYNNISQRRKRVKLCIHTARSHLHQYIYHLHSHIYINTLTTCSCSTLASHPLGCTCVNQNMNCWKIWTVQSLTRYSPLHWHIACDIWNKRTSLTRLNDVLLPTGRSSVSRWRVWYICEV